PARVAPPHAGCFLHASPPPTDIYTLSLHDALPIFLAHFTRFILNLTHDAGHVLSRLSFNCLEQELSRLFFREHGNLLQLFLARLDRKSTRLNSSHVKISYAVFCLKKKKSSCAHCWR